MYNSKYNLEYKKLYTFHNIIQILYFKLYNL